MDLTLAVRPARLGRAGGLRLTPRSALLAAGSLSAGLAHLGGVVQHLDVWWGYGAFFLVTGLAQAAMGAVVLWRPAPWVALVGIVGNLAIVGMYVLTRTVGIPLGPHSGRAEDAETLGMVTTAGELALVLLLIPMLGERAQRWTFSGLLALGIGLWALRFSGQLV